MGMYGYVWVCMGMYVCGFVLVGSQGQQVEHVELEHVDQRGEPALPGAARHDLQGIQAGGSGMYVCMHVCMYVCIT